MDMIDSQFLHNAVAWVEWGMTEKSESLQVILYNSKQRVTEGWIS